VYILQTKIKVRRRKIKILIQNFRNPWKGSRKILRAKETLKRLIIYNMACNMANLISVRK